MFCHIYLAALLGAILYFDAATAAETDLRSPLCKSRNGYYPVDGNCDSFIECREYVAHEMLCPDGLHFNPSAAWPAYACGYPMDVPCKGRGSPQPANPTAECPHQYGFYPSPLASPSDCGQYRMCVEGRAVEMMCPPGLAFNLISAQCDWPDQVPSCNSDSFLGFKCPPAPLSENGEPLDIVMNYKYEGNCYAFYSCHGERARLLTCDAGYAFDAARGSCVDAHLVRCDSVPMSPVQPRI